MSNKSFPAALIAFALVSLVSQTILSRQVVGEARLYFPGVQPQLFTKLTESLRAQPELSAATPGNNEELGQMALVILGSQAAREAVLEHTGARAGLKLLVEKESGGAIHLTVRASNPKLAHDQIEALLEYYTEFVKRTPLTRVSKARADLDARLAQNVKTLARLEDALVSSADRDLRRVGDSTLKANPKVLTQIWQKRLDEQQKSRMLLRKLEALREKDSSGQLPGSQWLQDWAGKRLYRPPASSSLSSFPVRRQDLLAQARLERDYYDALLDHRSLILQRSFLLTWEKLENSNFELVDSINVTPYRPQPWLALLLGIAAALLTWLLSRWNARSPRGEF